MLKKILILCVFLGFFSLSAQSLPDSTESSKEKHLGYAILLETLFPFAGYEYAGDISQGIMPRTLQFSGILILLTHIETEPADHTKSFEIENKELTLVGLGLFLGGTIWTYRGLISTFKKNNSVTLTVKPHKKTFQPMLSVNYSF